jgi:phage terminase large subunit-like protein
VAKRGRKRILSDSHLELKQAAEADLEKFINLVHSKRLLGNIHRRVISWWTREDAKHHQLLLLPRDHMKSALIAYRVAWELTKDPTKRILYISSTSNLATKQLKFIKDIITSDTYRLFWPDMVEKDEAKREKWTEREISLDHPLRKEESIRDPSIFTAGLTSNIVGLHCDIAVLDDVVVQGNAYTEDGREKVKEQYSYLSSVESADSREWVVGTRYHPLDLYNDLMQMEIEKYDELGNVSDTQPLYEKMEEAVESIGDGSGEYLWPKQQRSDGRWFGFDQEVLGKKRAQYLNKTHFRAQYYNDPHDVGSSVFKRELFQYYEPGFLSNRDGKWFFKGERLNVFAAIDFAFTLHKKSDYSCIAVVGVDNRNNYYVLEIDRFKTDKISEYFKHILALHGKWGFRKIRAEVTSAQSTIVKDLKENYIRPHGLSLSVEEFKPTRFLGAKEERIAATLEPKYANLQVWHYQGGNIQVLEEELMFTNPAHDDVKDALASCLDICVAPVNVYRLQKDATPAFQWHQKFGGVA